MRLIPRTLLQLFQPHPQLSGTEVWIPLDTDDPRYVDRGMRSIGVVGRLAGGITVRSARSELWDVMQQILEDHPEGNGDTQRGWFGAGINTLHQDTVGDIGATFSILLASVGFLLLVACANVANLFMARSVDRARELGLRMALGAGRARVVRQLITESVVLGLLGGALGIALSYGGVATFLRFAPGGLPRTAEVGVDLRVLVFALSISVVTGVLFGVGPALQLTAGRMGDALRTRHHGTGPGGAKLRIPRTGPGGEGPSLLPIFPTHVERRRPRSPSTHRRTRSAAPRPRSLNF